jgi:hypothetical protein
MHFLNAGTLVWNVMETTQKKWSHCVPFVFNKLLDKKYLIFKVFIWLTYVFIHISARVVVYFTTLDIFIIWLRMRGLLLNSAVKGCSRKNFWFKLKHSSRFVWWDRLKPLKFRQCNRSPCRYFELELPKYVTGVTVIRLYRSVSVRVVSGLRQRSSYTFTFTFVHVCSRLYRASLYTFTFIPTNALYYTYKSPCFSYLVLKLH